MTPEQEAMEVGKRLVDEFGIVAVAAGTLLAHFTNAINTLHAQAQVGVTDPEVQAGIEEIRHDACRFVHQLYVLYVPDAAERQKIIEVAKRLYTSADLHLLDEMEQKEGLPPYPKLG